MDDVSFGALLRQFRRAANLSQQALAERANLSSDAVAALERGRRHPRPATIGQLADALQLSPDERAALTAAAHSDPSTPPQDAPQTPRPPLPIPPTPLIGREREVQAAVTLLRPAAPARPARLLTLVGPGGVGKTRLALAVARALQDGFADGVVFISLTAIRDPVLVPRLILQHLGLPERPEMPPEQRLRAALRPLELLLVLDNLEQVAAAAPLIAGALAAAPRLQVLATSQVSLHLSGEHELPVPPLGLPAAPDRWGAGGAQDAAESAAVQLFVQRARAINPAFALTPETLPAVAAICTALDGLPLAIELAAARIRLSPPQALLARLTSRLALLVNGPGDLPERQRTMRAAIAWSYDLLSPAEQAVLARLSVCVGGFPLGAAEALCAAEPALPVDPLETIESLLSKSLLHPLTTSAGEPRLRMLEAIREYAQEQLRASPARGAAEACHAAYYLGLLAQADSALGGPEQVQWLDLLEREHDNLRAMLAYTLGHVPERLLPCTDALGRFWLAHGHFSEGRQWLEQLLGLSDLVPLQRAMSLSWASLLARRQGDYPAAKGWIVEALTLWRVLGDRRSIDMALTSYAFLELHYGNVAHADELFAASVTLNTGEEHRRGAAIAWTGRSLAALVEEDYPQAQAYASTSLDLWLAVGDPLQAAYARTNLGHALAGLGAYDAAIEHLRQALTQLATLGERSGVAECLEGLASALGAKEPLRAAQLLGSAQALRDAGQLTRSPADQRAYDRLVARACAGLSAAARRTAMAEGRMLRLDQVIADLGRTGAHQPAAP